MKINLKYGYVVDVDKYNPYTLMREEVKDGKATSRDRLYYYNLERLAEALQHGKDYMYEYVQPIRALHGYQEEVVSQFAKKFAEVKFGQVYDKDLIEIDLGGYIGVYTPNNRMIALDKKVVDAEGNPVYEIPKEGASVEPKQVTKRLSYCKWLSGFVSEYVIANLVDKYVEDLVSVDEFIELYEGELEVFLGDVTIERTVVKPEVEEDDDLDVSEGQVEDE